MANDRWSWRRAGPPVAAAAILLGVTVAAALDTSDGEPSTSRAARTAPVVLSAGERSARPPGGSIGCTGDEPLSGELRPLVVRSAGETRTATLAVPAHLHDEPPGIDLVLVAPPDPGGAAAPPPTHVGEGGRAVVLAEPAPSRGTWAEPGTEAAEHDLRFVDDLLLRVGERACVDLDQVQVLGEGPAAELAALAGARLADG